jgi:hypothetical protein
VLKDCICFLDLYRVSQSGGFKKDFFKPLMSVPIPTVEQPIKEPGDYSTEGMITFSSVSNQVLKLGGLSAPKAIEVRGSNGRSYKIIFKVV